MPYLVTSQRTFKLPNGDDTSTSTSEMADTEQQARNTAKQLIDDAFQSHNDSESIQVEVTNTSISVIP